MYNKDNTFLKQENFCGTFKFKNAADFPLMEYNDDFCHLYCCTQSQLTYKYNMSFTALLEEEGLVQFDAVLRNWDFTKKNVVSIKHGVFKNKARNFLQTNISGEQINGEEIFTGISIDISSLIEEKSRMEDFKEVTMLAIDQVNMGYFEYSLDEDKAILQTKGAVLIENLWDSNGVCSNFLNELTKQGAMDHKNTNMLHETINLLKRGEKKAICELKLKNQQEDSIWVKLSFIKQKNRNNSQHDVVGVWVNVTKEKETFKNYLNETLYYQNLLADQDAYAEINVTENRITRIGGLWNLYNELIDKITFTQLCQQFIHKVVHKEDRKQYLEIMSHENLMESYNNGIERLGYEFRRITEQNKMVWMQLNVSLFKDPMTKHILALMSLKNIDSWKRQEIKLQYESGLNSRSDFVYQKEIDEFDTFLSKNGEMSYLINTKTLELICGNRAFYDRLGMTEEECRGMKCYEAMHKREAMCPFCSKANWSTDKFHIWKNMNLNLEQEFLIKNKLVTFEGEEVLLTIAVDISNNKSIVDSLENHEMESHNILSGVQRMADADTMQQSMSVGLESIGYFFRAERVRWWSKKSHEDSHYECKFLWNKGGTEQNRNVGKKEIQSWLNEKTWDNFIFIESKEAMLCLSYDMYQYMNQQGIHNQRWIRLKEGEEEYGYIVVENISSNFQNKAFLEAFSIFIEGEYRQRNLIEAAIYSKQHDSLTDLKSRYGFETYMTKYNADHFGCIGVLLANFNNLKQINSTLGFHTGNFYIQAFANMLRDTFGHDEIFRLNGDEFLVICTDTSRGFLEEKMGILEKTVKEIGLFSVSYGYAWDDVENDLTVLLEQANQAMKINKKRHYDSEPSTVDVERRKMLSDLFKELEQNRFEVFFAAQGRFEHRRSSGCGGTNSISK